MSEESPILILTGIASELGPDVGIAQSRAIGSTDSVALRGYVHAFFALVEGLNYARLHVSKESPHLSEDARQKADVAARVEKRQVQTDSRRDLGASTRISFAAFAAAHGVANPLTPCGTEWQDFLDAVAVRDRITHPRSGAHCRLVVADFELVSRAHVWYQRMDMELFANVGEAEQDGLRTAEPGS